MQKLEASGKKRILKKDKKTCLIENKEAEKKITPPEREKPSEKDFKSR